MVIAVSYPFGVLLWVSYASIPKIIKIGPKTKELWSFLSPPLLPLIFTENVVANRAELARIDEISKLARR